ncbi:hypothetical protein ACWDTQ_33955, partial [Streptomyces cellulosae]
QREHGQPLSGQHHPAARHHRMITYTTPRGTTLAIAGHDLQETLAESRAWIATESTVLSEVFDNCLTNLDAAFKQACSNAWNATPITAAAEMNLGGFGMGNQQHIVTTMERALAYRFGLRRLIPAFILRRLFRRLQLLRA